MNGGHFPSQIKLRALEAEERAFKTLKQRLWHFTSVGLGKCRAAQITRHELSRRRVIQSALLANAGYDPNELRDRATGEWTKEGNAGESKTNNPSQPAENKLPEAVIRPFTWREKLEFELRQLMFKWFPGTRPDGYPPPWKVLGAISMLLPFGIGPETKMGKLLLAYFIAKTAAAQRAYYGAIKQELQTGNYSDAGRHAVEDLLNIVMIAAALRGAFPGKGPKETGAGGPDKPGEKVGENNRPVESTAPDNSGAAPQEPAAFLEKAGTTGNWSYPNAPEAKTQIENLRKWAQATGRVRNFEPPPGAKLLGGNERDGYGDPNTNRVYKRTDPPGTFGFYGVGQNLERIATPYFYLRRIALMNEAFGSDIRVEGITPGDKPSIITSEPYRKADNPDSPHPSPAEVDQYMRSKGFEPLPNVPDGWIRKTDGIRAYDARPENFIKSEGKPVPVDVVLQQAPSTSPRK